VLQEYKAYLSRVRSFLAGTTRNRSTLAECERLLKEAKQCATAMRGLAEVEGNNMRVQEAKQIIERDIGPLAKEVERALNEMGREELFYQAPDVEQQQQQEAAASQFDSLIQSSDDLLRESQAVLAETEHIGTSTLQQMGRQREQIEGASRNAEAVRDVALQAKRILMSMGRKACKSKLALYAMIGLLMAANLYLLFDIFTKHHHTPN
jgi:vesicle transport through interaction with t-SNAREs protein 1